jgi:hypothetical protein
MCLGQSASLFLDCGWLSKHSELACVIRADNMVRLNYRMFQINISLASLFVLSSVVKNLGLVSLNRAT